MRKKLWLYAGIMVAIIIVAIMVGARYRVPTSNTGSNGTASNTSPPPHQLRVYTQDIMMVTEETNLAIPFGYRLEVNWGYAPIHTVTDAEMEAAKITMSPGHTNYGRIQELAYRFNSGREVKPVKLHCTYTEQPGF